MSILDSRTGYKPFQYPWCFDLYRLQQQAHWLPEEVPMKEDINDYDQKLTDGDRRVLTQVLKFFTQADLGVADNYIDRLTSRFHLPEVRMMLSAFAAMEAVHAHGYSFLSDSLNLDRDPTFYSAFNDIAAMRAKHDFLATVEVHDTASLARDLAIFGGFVEGVQLFASFAILFNLPRRNLMKGTGQIITWSIRDESLHCRGITKLFRTLIEENPSLWTDGFKRELYDACETVVGLEDAFVDACFDLGDIPGMRAQDVKTYVRHMANVRLGDLALKPIYTDVKANPFPWLDAAINAVEHVNFFEGRSTSYAKAAILDDLPR